MAARIEYDTCPYCGEIRNTSGLQAHINKKHPAAVTA